MSLDTRLARLASAAPGWFKRMEAADEDDLVGRARPPETPWEFDGIDLRISAPFDLEAAERVPGTCLPRRCPERHIQSDQTFCLGLRRLIVDRKETALQWWSQLLQYMQCQATAEQTGVWPPGHALDHGVAGEHHERALALAEALNEAEAYEAAHNNEPSWITDPRLKLLDEQGRPLNGRAPCPRQCTRRGTKILRRDCPRRAEILDLVAAERQRRRALAAYWVEVLATGIVCCGSMRECELRVLAGYVL